MVARLAGGAAVLFVVVVVVVVVDSPFDRPVVVAVALVLSLSRSAVGGGCCDVKGGRCGGGGTQQRTKWQSGEVEVSCDRDAALVCCAVAAGRRVWHFLCQARVGFCKISLFVQICTPVLSSSGASFTREILSH